MNILRGACSTPADWLRDALTRAQGEWRCSRSQQGGIQLQRWIFVRTTRACGQAGVWDRAGLAEHDVPAPQAVKPFAEAHKVNYGTEICGVAAGANSQRKLSKARPSLRLTAHAVDEVAWATC
jgi:hypothetical protein